MNQQPRRRGLILAMIFTLALLGVAGVVVWRAIQGPGVEISSQRPHRSPDDSTDLPEGAENLTEEERQVLEDLLQRKGGDLAH